MLESPSMDRRRFLQMCGGGLVATATMQEVEFFAEFMAWLKRRPAWSFPNPSIGPYVDFMNFSDLGQVYFDKIKQNSTFVECSLLRPLPAAHRHKAIQMFQYAINPAGID